jgi:tetratricopeptide (TPR) repeat protein
MKSQKTQKNWIVISGLALVTGFSSANSFAADLATDSKGRAPGAHLKMKKSNVPQYNLAKNKSKPIPRLDVGEEAKLRAVASQAPTFENGKTFKEPTLNRRVSPPQYQGSKALLKGVGGVPGPKRLVSERGNPAPGLPNLADVGIPNLQEPQVQLVKIEELPPSQLKLLQALIFLEIKKDYPMALALFAELLDEPVVKTEATYHLAMTARALGLYSEYKHRMLQLLNDKKVDWQRKAAFHLATHAGEGDVELVEVLEPKLEALKIDLDKADAYEMNRAKYFLEKGDLTKAFAGVDEIPMDSPNYIDSLFLKSLILYKGGQLQEAIGLQQTVLKDVLEKRPDSEFKSIVAITLARLHFQAGQYKEAYEQYLKVDKTHPEWLQSMIEQAWAQVLSEDYEGATGNMFSLHTDFFKKAFAPESYVVRTVGYLNLCQYGDGAKVVYDFKKKYTPVLAQLKEYQTKMKQNVNYYDTIKSWAKNSDLKTYDGLPREFIFALTRHPSFMLQQKMINSIEDQLTKMNKISIDLIKTERAALAAQSDAKQKMASVVKKNKEKDKNSQDKEALSYQEKRLMSYKIQYYIAQKARNSIKELRTEGLVRLEKEKAHFRDLAGKAVKSRFGQMYTKLSTTLDQGEVLKYELYSGAGEHLRYQLAGGEVKDKEHAELKAEQGKDLNWDFRGEIWEDEIGHYRSSLKSVCQPDDKVSSVNTPDGR